MKNRTGVLVVLFLLTSFSAMAATEIQISHSPTLGDFAPPIRLRTSVASNGRGYVVAWEAAKVATDDVTDIYIRVLGPDGVPLRPFPTLLGSGREPRVVWNGHEYLVVWGITSGVTGREPTPSVVGMRLREDGTLIDAKPVTLISEENPFSYYTSVEWNGSQYLITWSRGMALVDADLQHFRIVGSAGGTPFYSATLGGSFVVLSSIYSSTGFSLYVQPVSQSGEVGAVNSLKASRGNIAPFAGGYALIWDDEINLHSGLLSAEGRPVSSLIIGPGRVGFPRLATRDGRLVASWESMPDDKHTRICTVRLESMFQPVCSAVSAGQQHDPSIGTSSTSTLVAWVDQTGFKESVRVLPSPLSEAPHVEALLGRSISDASSMPAAERRADGGLAVAWSEYNKSTGHFEVHLGGTNNKGLTVGDRALFAEPVDQTLPAVATGAGRTMAVWEEGPAESSKIRMTVIEEATTYVVASAPLGSGSAPAIAFDGKEWLATWQSSGVVRFAVINSDGTTIASGSMPAETLASSIQTAPAVAWSGKTFLLTWREAVPAGERIEMATVSPAGMVSAALALDSADAGLAAPSVAAGGGRLLVSWGTPSGTIRQALFDSGGKQLGKLIDFAWPYAVSRTRTHAMVGGFATLAGSRIALTSLDGRALDSFDVPEVAAGGEFAVDAANRFTLIYSRQNGEASIATLVQTIGLPRRRASNH